MGSLEDMEETAVAQPEMETPTPEEHVESAVDSDGKPIIKSGKKKKKGRKGGAGVMKRGPTGLTRDRGTGFEEFYADPPMTAAEAQNEKNDIYAPDIPFHERMEACVQRFRGRRRLDQTKVQFFNEYLFLGGIDTGPRQFTGLDKADLTEMTTTEIRDLKAVDRIVHGGGCGKFYDPSNPEHWDVDFKGVAAGFLSYRLLGETTNGETTKRLHAVDVVQNFLNYVLQHDVCPEYQDNVNAARLVCERARVELPLITQAARALPGNFNRAAKQFLVDGAGGSAAEITLKVGIALAAMQAGDSSLVDRLRDDGPVDIIRKSVESYRVDGLQHPSEEDLRRISKLQTMNNMTGASTLQPVGRLVLKSCTIEDGWATTPTEAEFDESTARVDFFIVEEDVLKVLVPGMKLKLDVVELSIGLKIITKVHNVWPSYYTFLPQELMWYYKTPELNLRPAPSIHDPNFEERAAMVMMKRELEEPNEKEGPNVSVAEIEDDNPENY